MKIFVSYQQTWVSYKDLTEKLWKIRSIIWWLKHDNFIYFLDVNFKNQSAGEIILKAKQEIESSDLVLAFVDYEQRSEGMMLELGVAYWWNKKILFIINNKFKENYFLSYWITDNSLFFDDFSEIEWLLKNKL